VFDVAWPSTVRRPHTHAAPIREDASVRDQRTLASEKGSVFSREGFLQDQLVEREFRDGLPQPLVLPLQLLEPLRLIELQAAVLAPPLNGMDGSPSSTEAVGLGDYGGGLWK